MRLILVQPQLGFRTSNDNLDAIESLLDGTEPKLGEDDILLLPEHFHLGSADEYDRDVSALARRRGCCVVGGSHHRTSGDRVVNSGSVVAPDGSVLVRYEKLRPYAEERTRVDPGSVLGEVTLGERHVLILICADFWFSDLFARATHAADLVLVPALSVTRKSGPEYSRALWKHLAVGRAYEFGVYVGVSDWGHPSELPALITCGVGGFADPTRTAPDAFFTPIGPEAVRAYPLDFDALDTFRRDRQSRGFFWKELE